MPKNNFSILFVFAIFHSVLCGMHVDNVEQCPEHKVTVSFTDLGTTADGLQKLNANFTFVEPIDNNDIATVTIYTLKDGKWNKLFTVPQKMGTCQVLETFLGNIWAEVLRLNGKPPKSCPIQGLFRATNYKFDGRHVRIPLPAGKIKVGVVLNKKKSGKFVDCFDFILSQV